MTVVDHGTELVPADANVSDEEEISRLAEQIDIYSMRSIHGFGNEIAERTGLYTDRVLEQSRTDDLDETGQQLTEIIIAAQEFDVDSVGAQLSRTPVLGGLFKRLNKAKERAVGRFETIRAQVDKLVSEVEKTANTLDRRNHEYQNMYESVQEEHHLIGLHVAAIKRCMSRLQSEIKSVSGGADGMHRAEKLAVLEANYQALSKRSDDLTVLQHSALQMLPMVRIIQSNNLALIDKFQTVRQLTLPAWKRAFMLALALDEQKDAVKLTNMIDDTTNGLLRRNAELLHQNAVETASANQRLVIDVDTLKEVHDKIISTLSDVRQIHVDGAAERHDALSELQRMQVELVDNVKALSHVETA